ncbi:MAG: hypothetical protein M5U26_02520 [Planctomycetota bacterium]|nr:hypothetical protein [Planctomycetota bacterium]
MAWRHPDSVSRNPSSTGPEPAGSLVSLANQTGPGNPRGLEYLRAFVPALERLLEGKQPGDFDETVLAERRELSRTRTDLARAGTSPQVQDALEAARAG